MSKELTAEQAIGLLKHHIETWNAKFPEAHIEACETAIRALDLVKRIESLPTRTIETLEEQFEEVSEQLLSYENDVSFSNKEEQENEAKHKERIERFKGITKSLKEVVGNE